MLELEDEDDDDDEDEDIEEDESEGVNNTRITAARIARLLQGRVPFRNMIFRLSNGNGGFIELGGPHQRRRRPPTQDVDVDPIPSVTGQELMRSGDFGAVSSPGRY